jgi:hypothetical protein
MIVKDQTIHERVTTDFLYILGLALFSALCKDREQSSATMLRDPG